MVIISLKAIFNEKVSFHFARWSYDFGYDKNGFMFEI